MVCKSINDPPPSSRTGPMSIWLTWLAATDSLRLSFSHSAHARARVDPGQPGNPRVRAQNWYTLGRPPLPLALGVHLCDALFPNRSQSHKRCLHTPYCVGTKTWHAPWCSPLVFLLPLHPMVSPNERPHSNAPLKSQSNLGPSRRAPTPSSPRSLFPRTRTCEHASRSLNPKEEHCPHALREHPKGRMLAARHSP